MKKDGTFLITKFGNDDFYPNNSGATRYLVPLNTQAEFDAFWNAIPRLTGLYTIP
ncbi:MAG: hypothetical protein Q7S52_03755 [bacterium]|nr:hypothetical protein [bacterium]